MKPLLLFIAAALYGQVTTITGPLSDASGSLATCQLTIRPTSVPGFSPTIIPYTIVAGDLTGASGGYGTSLTSIYRHAALSLYPGLYSALVACNGGIYSSKTYNWIVPPVATWSIARLNQGTGQRLGEMTTTLGTTPLTLGAQ